MKSKHIYICHVDGYIGAFNPYTNKVRYETADNFIPFVKKLLKDFPDYSPHNIVNHGIEEVIRKQIITDKLINDKQKEIYAKAVGLTIEMDEERGVGHAR